MRVYFARLERNALEDSPALRAEALARVDRVGRHELSADAENADLGLFTQCHMLPRDWRLSALRDHPLTRRYRDKVMVFDERDRPWCAFPGVYVSMPRTHFEDRFQRAWGDFPAAPIESTRQPDLLFSF